MPESDNDATTIVLEMRDEIAAFRADRAPAQPFMTEKKSPKQAIETMDKMSRGDRKVWIKKIGEDNVLKMLREGA